MKAKYMQVFIQYLINCKKKIKEYGLPKATHCSLIFNLYGRKIKIN